jgi:hypothetical protein
MKKIFTLFLLINAFGLLKTNAQSTTVVISQVYGGGGGSTGTYIYDYIELHNISNSVQDISGLRLVYGSSAGNMGSSSSNIYTFGTGTTLPVGGYFLLQCGAAGTAGAAFPVTADSVTTGFSMSGSSGKVALVKSTFTVNTAITVIPTADVVDWVAYGAGTPAEGGASVNNGVALTSTQGCVRKTNGCTETDNNNLDFDVITAPVPRNRASTAVNCTTTPIKLSSFNAIGLKNSVNLSWLSHADQTGGSFVVERSIDGSNFENISTINANSLGNASYEATDRNLPAVKTLYYRLKIVNADGKYEYSNIQKVQLRDVKLTVSPNPASNEILINASENIKAVEVYDIRGRRMMIKDNINQNQTRINVTTLKDGSYIVKTLVDGEVTTNQIMVKH